MNQEKIGKFIAKLRKEKNLTQEQLAEKIFMDRGTISKWERGLYVANPEILLKLSEIFDVSVNEILVGERENEKNQDVINQVPIEILKDNRKKDKKIKYILTFGTIIIFLLLISFLTLYFIHNYNSISVYKISGNGTNFYMDDGLMIISKEKAYIKLGNIRGYNSEYNSVRLYYILDEKQIDLLPNSQIPKLITNIFGYNEFFDYKDIEIVKKNLFLEITFNNKEKEIIKLTSIRDFSNNRIFSKNEFDNISNSTDNESLKNEIPKYIIDNFKYDSSQNSYNLLINDKNIQINQMYLIDAKIYIVDEIKNQQTDHYEYSFEEKNITYSKYIDFDTIKTFTYNLGSSKCLYGDCDIDIIKNFNTKYIDMIN